MEIYRLTNVPETLFYVPNFISENEEKELISSVMNVPKTRWVQLRNRRLQNWGGQPHSNGMIQTELLPKWLEPFTERIVQLDENATIFPQRNFQFNHCLVNEYQPGQGIMAHTDGPVYYPIVTTISLQAPIVIEFYKPIDENVRSEKTNSNKVSMIFPSGNSVDGRTLCCQGFARTAKFVHRQRFDVQIVSSRNRRSIRRFDRPRKHFEFRSNFSPRTNSAERNSNFLDDSTR